MGCQNVDMPVPQESPTGSPQPQRSDQPRIEAIGRALVLLTALAEAGPGGASLAQLAEATGINKSTAYRALSTFRLHGYATQTASGDYLLGPAALGLSDRFLSRDNLVRALHPALVEISREAQELVHLGTWQDDEVVYLDKVEPAARAIRVWSAIGQRVPVASSSLGRALLAARGTPDGSLGVYIRSLPPDRVVTEERLRDSLRQARASGYSTENEENEPGVACIGLALTSHGDAVAAISITSLASRMTPNRQRELADMLRRVLPPLLPDGVELFEPVK